MGFAIADIWHSRPERLFGNNEEVMIDMKKNFWFWFAVWLVSVVSGALYWGWSWSGLIGGTAALIWVLWPSKKPEGDWDDPGKS